MRESGRVVAKISADVVRVELRPSSSCLKCGLCSLGPNGALTMDAVDKMGASIGSTVEIEIPESHVIKSALLIFICPLLAFFGGFLIGGVFLGVAALLVYLTFLFFYDRKINTVPRISRVLYN